MESLLPLWRRVLVMRELELELGRATAAGEVHGEMHLGVGQETVAAALESCLADGDAVISTHRPHLHALAAGVDPVRMIAEILERDGLNHGKGGHMHLFDPSRQFMCTGIVGAGAPIALGYALAQRLSRASTNSITVSILGDGSMNQGAVFESLNLAAVLRLPVLFLVENNEYGISVPRSVSTAGAIHERGQSMRISGFHVDGRDVGAMLTTLRNAIDGVRREQFPSLVVADVYRFRGHYEGDLDLYRPEAEKRDAISDTQDPLSRLESLLLAAGDLTEASALADRVAAVDEVASWFREARQLPYPTASTAAEGEFVRG